MMRKKIIVRNELGIHARVATNIAKVTRDLDSKVTLDNGSTRADGGSVLQILLLGAAKGSEVELVVDGGHEPQNLQVLSDLFSNISD